MSRIAEAAYGDTPYPDSPGFKVPGTSQEAAKAVSRGVRPVRDAVYAAIAASEGGLTADEAAAIVGRKRAYVRPRVSELAEEGRVRKTGRRRKNPETGLSATVWEAVR